MTIAAWPSSYRLQCNLNKATCKSLKDHWRKRKVQRCQRVWSGQFCFSVFKVQSLGMSSVSMQQNQQEKQSYSPSMHGCGNLFWEVRHLLHFIYKASSQAQDYYTENTNAKYEIFHPHWKYTATHHWDISMTVQRFLRISLCWLCLQLWSWSY